MTGHTTRSAEQEKEHKMSQAVLEMPSIREVRPVYREIPSRERAEAARMERIDRARRVVCIRRAIAENTYENDLKLSIALDRLMDELMHG
jgi:hypothetical protein